MNIRNTKDRELYRRLKTCTTKRRFISREEAAFPGQRVYKCPWCNQFHRTMKVTGGAA